VRALGNKPLYLVPLGVKSWYVLQLVHESRIGEFAILTQIADLGSQFLTQRARHLESILTMEGMDSVLINLLHY